MMDGWFHPAVSVEEKDCWRFSVAWRKLNVRKYYKTICGRLSWFCCQRSFTFVDKARGVVAAGLFCRVQVAGWNVIITGKPLALKIINNLYTRQGFLHKVVRLFHMVKTRYPLYMGYRPSVSSFLACLWTETPSRSINTQKKNLANIQPSWPNKLGQ